MAPILTNIGYFLIMVGLVIRDILWLRIVIMAGHAFLVSYAVLTGNKSVMFWNGLFTVINIYEVIVILRERRAIKIPDDLKDLHENVFSGMTSREFLYFWETGQIAEVEPSCLIRQGEKQEKLSLILSGQVDVMVHAEKIATLARGRFIAEMSFLTAEPASADVVNNERIVTVSWDHQKLHHLETLNPSLYIKIQKIFAKELSMKLKSEKPVWES